MKFLKIQKILILFLFAILLTNCASKNKDVASNKEPNIYDGSIGLVLGCMFNPAECNKFKQQVEQDEITKDFEEVDKATSSSK